MLNWSFCSSFRLNFFPLFIDFYLQFIQFAVCFFVNSPVQKIIQRFIRIVIKSNASCMFSILSLFFFFICFCHASCFCWIRLICVTLSLTRCHLSTGSSFAAIFLFLLVYQSLFRGIDLLFNSTFAALIVFLSSAVKCSYIINSFSSRRAVNSS